MKPQLISLLFSALLVAGAPSSSEIPGDEGESVEETPGGKGTRNTRALPSVGPDHYSEVLSDGTYKYAYTGEHRYVAERRLADGTVEGESLYVRPDGVPIKVHYFADKEGFRPKSEVLYKERVVATRSRAVPVGGFVREVVPVHAAGPPPVILAPPRNGGENSVNVNLNDASLGGLLRNNQQNFAVDSRGGDVAIAQPSVTAIVGPGGRAVVRPEAVARSSSSSGSRYFRTSTGSGGDVAIASPQTTAIVGAGGSVVVEPRAAAYAGGGDPETIVKEVHHHHTRENVVVAAPPPTVVERHTIVERPQVIHKVASSHGYVYSPPQQVARAVPVPQAVAVPVPVVRQGVVVVPPSSRYSYSYGYSAPDPKHPGQGNNSAYVNVNVNN